MIGLIFVLAFLVGLVVGSFLNVVILRGVRGESIRGRSRCEACRKTLGARELIPILSYIMQKARCRSCGSALLWQYPLVELGTGAAFAVTVWYLGFPADYLDISIFQYLGLATALVAASAGIVILVADLRFQIIPNGAVLALLIAGIGRLLLQAKLGTPAPSLAWNNLAADIISALIAALFLASLWFFSRGRWMGLGDAKLIFATSLLVGFPASPVAILFAFWLGGVVGIFLFAAGRHTLKSRIPFGPFILVGAVLAFFLSGPFLAFSGLDLLL